MAQGTILKVEKGAWVSVTVPDEGAYVDPITGFEYKLFGFLGSHVGPGYAMSGWPTFYERLVPIGADLSG